MNKPMNQHVGIDTANGKDTTVESLVEQTPQGEIKFLGDVQRLELRPTDIIVLKSINRLSQHQAVGIKVFIENQFPGHRCIVIDDDMSIGIISPIV